MNKKRTLQNNLSYALKYMFDNYGIKIFLDPQKFTVTLSNLIPKLDEEIKLVEFALEKNAVAAIVNGYNKREVDKNFAYLRAKTILTKNGISEKTAIYIVDCFSYALSWIDELPDYESLSDEDFKIAKKTEDEPKQAKEPKKDVSLKKKNDNCELKSKPTIKLTKKNASELEKKEEKINDKIEDEDKSTKKIEPLYFEEKRLSSTKKEAVENKVIKEDNKIEEKEDDDKMSKKDIKPDVKTNSKYYLNHDFDDDEYDDDYDYDDDDEYESSSIFKKIALILIPILILGVLGFFIFKNYNKEAEPVLSGVSITTEYKIENGNYVLPISQETNLNVIIQSKNSKKIDTSKLSFKIENPSICTLKNNGKKCTITGLKEGNTNLVVIYNNEIVDSINLYFKDFVEPEEVAEPEDSQEQIDIEEETNTQEESVETQKETPTETYKNNTNNDIDNSSNNSSNNNNNENNSNNNSNNNNNNNKPKPEEPSEEEQKPEEPEKPSEEEQKPEEPEKPSEEEQKPEDQPTEEQQPQDPTTESTDSNSENADSE